MKYGFFGGAGTMGTWIRKAIQVNDQTMELAVIGDNNEEIVGQSIDGIPVVNAKTFASYYNSGKIDMVVLAVDAWWFRLNVVIKQLSELGIDKVYMLAQYIYEMRIEKFNVSESLFVIETDKPCMNGNLNIPLNRHCNLNCKGCGMFANLYEEECNMDIDVYKKDLLRLKDLFSTVRHVCLFGGEPLLNKQLDQYIVMVRQMFPLATISVETNGILLLSCDDSLFQTLFDNNAYLLITPYTLTQSNGERVKSKCDKFGVYYEYREDNVNESGMRTLFYKPLKISKTNEDIGDSYMDCVKRGSYYNWHIKNGFMSSCQWPLYIDKFNEKYSNVFVIEEKDTINIYNENLDGYQVLEYLSSPKPFCKYCAYENEREHFEWQISRIPQKEDWLIDG